ncbi:MAG: hypothetical protein WA441_10740 [Methyloceanibacter sp.]
MALQSQLVPLYEHQKGSAFDGMHQEGQFAAERLAAAVLRDMVVDAWHSSSEATVGYPPVQVQDVETGKVMPIEELKGAARRAACVGARRGTAMTLYRECFQHLYGIERMSLKFR